MDALSQNSSRDISRTSSCAGLASASISRFSPVSPAAVSSVLLTLAAVVIIVVSQVASSI
ncbi:MAG: hypothetical protein PHC51_07595 [bacterium]|nr:hypothetical protein [bacterium]